MSAQQSPTPHYGATPDEWDHFTLMLGLTADLLPVVSNPGAEISPDSKMKDIGKTPSRYNSQRKVAGIAQWTQNQADDRDVTRWARETDYGICIQTRAVRAIDVDVPDEALAGVIDTFITSHLYEALARDYLPKRRRRNSGKFLLGFTLPGTMAKRVLHVEGGIIEFLATGQQFIACGTHPSGARYEWAGGLPEQFPELTLEQFEALWAALNKRFSTAPAAEGKVGATKAERVRAALHGDPVAAHMFANSMVRSQDRDGKLHIVCPWESEHTMAAHDGDTSTTYWPAHTGGYINGHFKCLHAHCMDRTDGEFRTAVGYLGDDLADFDELGAELVAALPSSPELHEPSDLDDFIDMDDDGEGEPLQRAEDQQVAKAEKPARFGVIPAGDFAARPAPKWIIKGIMPRAELLVLFGESGAGKSFTALDLAGAVARGVDWRGHKVKQGRVVYVAAEGAGGFRNRLVAYAIKEGVTLADIPLGVIANAPNLLEKAEAIEVARAIGRADVVIIDTFAQATAGANENSGEDIGKALAHCKGIHRATGALVILVHHAGKDLTKGARGWSGLRAAADAEIEVSRQDPVRMLRMSKQKDGEDGTKFYFDLTTIPIGQDEDGDLITSCVMNYEVSAPVVQQKGPKLNQWEALVMSAVTLIGESQSAGIEKKAVIDDAIVEYKNGGGESKNAKDLARRAIKTLAEKGYFELEDDCINLLKGEI